MKDLMKRTALALVALAVVAVPASAQDCTLLNQNPDGANGFFSTGSCAVCGTGQQSVAENFVIGGAQTIEAIVVWGGYINLNTGGSTPASPDNFTVSFFSDAAGAPGGLIATESGLSGSRVLSVPLGIAGVIDEYRYSINITDVNLPGAGTYWIEVVNLQPNGDDWIWETASQGANGGPSSAFSTSAPGVAWSSTGSEDNLAVRILCDEGLIVVLESFTAELTKQGVVVRWTTSSEIDNAGFRVLRETVRNGEKHVEVASDGLIPGRGTNLEGGSYEFIDIEKNLAGVVKYFLEDIDVFGVVTRHGPVEVLIGGPPASLKPGLVQTRTKR